MKRFKENNSNVSKILSSQLFFWDFNKYKTSGFLNFPKKLLECFINFFIAFQTNNLRLYNFYIVNFNFQFQRPHNLTPNLRVRDKSIHKLQY